MKTEWRPEEINTLKELFGSHTRAQIGQLLGKSEASIRMKCMRLGLNGKHKVWEDWEVEEIRAAYISPKVGFLIKLATLLGRDKSTISMKARSLGLSDSSRKYGRKDRRKFKTPEELTSFKSQSMKNRIARDGHGRHMSGKHHTDATKAIISEASTRAMARRTPDEVEATRLKRVKTMLASYGRASMVNFGSSNPYSRTKSGKRADLGGVYFRSAWEANYARYLNFLISQKQIASWEYEAQCFVFHGITRGVISYTPDFKVYENNGTHRWHEVKGWMDAKSKAKLKRMAKFYPSESVIVIGKDEYNAIAPFSRLIEGWEE